MGQRRESEGRGTGGGVRRRDRSRELEDLIAKLEALMNDKSVEIRVRERIKSVTGDMREVDVSVRLVAGSASVLIVFECRGRRRTEDVIWIEQLAAKKDSVRANVIVAASTSGFTSSAIAAAKRFGVELRTLEELSGDDFRNWVPGFRAEHTRIAIGIKGVQVQAPRELLELSGGSVDAGYDDPIFVRPGTSQRLSLTQLVQEELYRRPPRSMAASSAGPTVGPTEERLTLAGPLEATINDRMWPVDSIVVDVELSTTKTPMPTLLTQRYETPAASAPHVARAVLSTKGVPDVISAAVSFIPSRGMLALEVETRSTKRTP